MKIVLYPDNVEKIRICTRPTLDLQPLFEMVQDMYLTIKEDGDTAVLQYAKRFEAGFSERLTVPAIQLQAACIDSELETAIDIAIHNIKRFHESQKISQGKVTTTPGISCYRRAVPIERVGLYIPGGTAPLISTLLMLAVPAIVAGCKEIVVCTPTTSDGVVHPAILVTARKLGIHKIIQTGGIQAICGMALGTESIPRVDKIFGPGNQYVSAAKAYVSLFGTAIDLPAGPSEVSVYLDEDANPEHAAADLLSQAEHGGDSQVLAITTSIDLAKRVEQEVAIQLEALPRKSYASLSLQGSSIVVVRDEDEAVQLINQYAPEHLILSAQNARTLADRIEHAGSVFIGYFTPESLGDYASGTNHVLPTNGAARSYSGVSLESFMRQITFQEASPEGLQAISSAVVALARAEGLEGHAQAVLRRLG